jgi:FlgD Ig-like domain
MRGSLESKGKHALSILLVLPLLSFRSAGAQDIQVAITPTVQEVAAGAVFDLDITVTRAGLAFNAFDAVVGYDPEALTLLPLSPLSQQEGALMVGACGNRFHQFELQTGMALITDVLLCNGVSVNGPGQIYRLRFQASSVHRITSVWFLPGLQFYNAGLFVNPVHATNAVIGIGTVVGVGPELGLSRLRLSVEPNPARDRTSFVVESDLEGARRATVFDVCGRLVRRLEDSGATVGVRALPWDGRDNAGRPLPAGVYVVRVEVQGRVASGRVSLLR